MRTETIAAGIIETHSDAATAEEIRGAFVSHREELRWLAGFLTGDDEVAEACLVDASAVVARQKEVCQQWLVRWTRLATIGSAIEMEFSRIAQLAAVYERRAGAHRDDLEVPFGMNEFLVEETDLIQSRLDILCRFALIMCGVEKCSAPEAAALLGISSRAVEAAYGVALESLEIMHCQALIECCGCGAA